MEFNQIDKALEIALENVIQYEHTLKKQQTVESELNLLISKEKELLIILEKENKDVDKIKGLSFQAFLGTLTGTLSDKIEKEELEALEAKNNYDRLCYDLNEHKQLLSEIKVKINSLSGARENYANALKNKREYLADKSPTTLENIYQIEDNIEQVMYLQKEVNEAEHAANDLWNHTCTILDTLGSAKNWGIYDMVGGGVIATSIKRDKMSTARDQINVLNRKIDAYCKELKDVNINEITHIDLESLNFLDYFVNSIFVDWQVQENINNAIDKIKQLQSQIKHNEKVLHDKKEDNLNKVKDMKKKIDELIINA